MKHRGSTLLLFAALVLTGCAGGWHAEPGPAAGNGVANFDGATVVTGQELHESNGSVLRAIMGKVPNMKVNFTGLLRCPAIALRRFEEINGHNFPSVYVDGTRTHDTCVLESIQAHDVDRVEVYPAGFTKRPGYATSTHGLILIFSRRSAGDPMGS